MVSDNLNPYRKVLHLKSQVLIADQCLIAQSFLLRARGLIGKRNLPDGEGLLIRPCNSIHMWFMSIPIDAVFLRRKEAGVFEVLSMYQNLQPWKFLPVSDFSAQDTLELPKGTLSRFSVQVGDFLCLN
jgi:uncharacterized membrane protein (UPF0127 family)